MKAHVWMTFILVAAFSQLTVRPSSGQEYAEASGTVRDAIGASIVGASVEFSSKANHYLLTIGNDGRYSVRLAPGTYRVTAKEARFCDGHRAPFSIAANQKVQIDFVLPIDTQASDSPISQDSSCYKEDEPTIASAGELRPLVLFGSEAQKSGVTYYSSLERHTLPYPNGSDVDERYPVVFSYGLMTLTADTVVYARRDESVTGIGNATLQNGAETRHGSKVSIAFSQGKIVATRIE